MEKNQSSNQTFDMSRDSDGAYVFNGKISSYNQNKNSEHNSSKKPQDKDSDITFEDNHTAFFSNMYHFRHSNPNTMHQDQEKYLRMMRDEFDRHRQKTMEEMEKMTQMQDIFFGNHNK